MRFKHYSQLDQMDCGPACIQMIAKYYGKYFPLNYLRSICQITRDGVTLFGIAAALEKIGLKTLSVKVEIEQLKAEIPLPCILFWNQNHYVVLYDIKTKAFSSEVRYCIADPAANKIQVNEEDFLRRWYGDNANEGIALLVEPTIEFELTPNIKYKGNNFALVFRYLKPYQKMALQLGLAMGLASLIELAFPLLTKTIVDVGILNQDISFVYVILCAQLMFFLGKTIVEVVRSWLLQYIAGRVNITIISDYINKLTKLPLSFFDAKQIGDITNRIGDHQRIEFFLTSNALYTFFSLVNLLFFSFIIAYYNLVILWIFLGGATLSICWILFFLKWRRNLDYALFYQVSEKQNHIYEIIEGISEIKISGAETLERWKWERIQSRIFKLKIRSLRVEQWQVVGSRFIDQIKNILIIFFCAKEVIAGQLTLGTMMSITFIVGQMDAPVEMLIIFFRAFQDATISFERLNEIHNNANESEGDNRKDVVSYTKVKDDIELKDVCFKYNKFDTNNVINQVNVTIPHGKVTAIVGASGSGKTTLLKLLLKFYVPDNGSILIGKSTLADISTNHWRAMSGVVMQDGYIFGKTIAENIALGFEYIDQTKLQEAATIACIKDFISELPLGFDTKVGSAGVGLSSGQKQRILIARAIYKNPTYLFLDEATSSLDANNEKSIMEQLNSFFIGRTVVVIAHRLSTVKDADNIIVLDKGKIIEEGTHLVLTKKKGAYYNLVKNQLELGL